MQGLPESHIVSMRTGPGPGPVTSRLAGQWAGPARRKWRGIGKQATDKKSGILAFKLRSVFPQYLMQIRSKCHNQTQIRKVQFKTQKMAPWVWI